MAVLGPTAAGKSEVAEAIAGRIGAEILSVDSMQVFRGMDIGTAKPDLGTRRRFVYHLVDVADPPDEYTVADFQDAGTRVLDRIESSGGTVVIAGGSGLHFRSLVDPLEFPPTDGELRAELELLTADALREELLGADPAAGEVIDVANPRRVLRAVEITRLTGATPTSRAASDQAQAVRTYQPLRAFTAIGVDPGPAIRQRIEKRFDAMACWGRLPLSPPRWDARRDRRSATGSSSRLLRRIANWVQRATTRSRRPCLL
ncbi:MAG: isopentenyl transferase family protein [Actinomycetota bacterium]|nr:isopentenyl transferase family protein [Actinomycetota bacterium]